MSSYIINGGRRLNGSLTVQGSKNSVLPIICAAYLAEGKSVIHNCPHISDVDAAIKILKILGCTVRRDGNTLLIDSTVSSGSEIPEELMCEMRSSVLFLGALLGRTGEARVFSPGGCRIGARPIDLHITAMQKLGASTEQCGEKLFCRADGGLAGNIIHFPFPSVGATENALIAACTARGTTVIKNAAREPEVSDLCAYLNKCGAEIVGAGESVITVNGVKKLHAAEHTVISDRISTVTFLAAAAATGGDITLKNTVPAHLSACLEKLKSAGCSVSVKCSELRLRAPARLTGFGDIYTAPYPGFPTDAQAQFSVPAALANGTTTVCEKIFEDRFGHINELRKMGADIKIIDNKAVINGVKRLEGAKLYATDLRCGGALVLAGLAAEGVTQIENLCYIDRGYENLEKSLCALNADIKRVL